MFFDIAIVNSNHQIEKKKVCKYEIHMDIASNIYSAYKELFNEYKIEYVGVGVSNNIEYKDDIIYSIKSMRINRYNLKTSLYKLFKKDICILNETDLAAISYSVDNNSNALLYVLVDSKISNSFVVDSDVIYLEDDINLSKSDKADLYSEDTFKRECLNNDLDDEYVPMYLFSTNKTCKKIVEKWCKILSEEINRVIKELPVEEIAFSGYMGEYYEDFKEYMNLPKKIKCGASNKHRENTLRGVSHLMFKDN